MGEVGRILAQVDTVGLQGLGGADEMRKKLEEHDQIRAVILDYIDRNLVKDVDYGWTDERSMDKSTLKKPGAEKVCRMFNTHPRWVRDYEVWEMAGKPPATIFLICQIVDNETGKVIGEGRGAAKIGEKARDANKTIKNAEKCSIVDAALYTFMLSEKFTQDDGGKSRATLSQLKQEFNADVDTMRSGVSSSVTGQVWSQTVIRDFLHKTRVDTIGEFVQLRKAIFEDKLYDMDTGKRIGAEDQDDEILKSWKVWIDDYFTKNKDATDAKLNDARAYVLDKTKNNQIILEYFDTTRRNNDEIKNL